MLFHHLNHTPSKTLLLHRIFKYLMYLYILDVCFFFFLNPGMNTLPSGYTPSFYKKEPGPANPRVQLAPIGDSKTTSKNWFHYVDVCDHHDLCVMYADTFHSCSCPIRQQFLAELLLPLVFFKGQTN